jgi:hypothetical protein
MTLTEGQQQRRDREIGDRAKRLGRWLALFALEEGQSTDELKGQLPPLLLVIEQAAIQYLQYLHDVSADVAPDPNTPREALYCSFCGKGQHEVKKLIAGPDVCICDECVDLCVDIFRQEQQRGEVENNNRDQTPEPC